MTMTFTINLCPAQAAGLFALRKIVSKYKAGIIIVMVNSIFILVGSLILVLKGATFATRYASSLAESFRLPRYTVGFIIVSFISILPETFIAVSSALEGLPAFGLGTLFGSNIADLTLIFAIIVFYTGRKIKIEGTVLKNIKAYPFLILLPLVLGIDGYFSRIEGISLIIAGGVFFYTAFKGTSDAVLAVPRFERAKYALFLVGSMALLLIGSHFTVTSAVSLAGYIGVSPVLIGMLIVGIGTTIPELVFAVKAVEDRDDSLGVGDILGTVMADATIVVGILAAIRPFAFPIKIIYVTGAFMLVASVALIYCMRTGRTISSREALFLLFFWLCFVITEYFLNT